MEDEKSSVEVDMCCLFPVCLIEITMKSQRVNIRAAEIEFDFSFNRTQSNWGDFTFQKPPKAFPQNLSETKAKLDMGRAGNKKQK